MARPRKNPFGERKDTGIGYDGTRTNNPFARPTKSSKRRDQWDLADQANIVFEQKQEAKRRAEEARQRAADARKASEERARKRRQEEQWMFNNPEQRDKVADFYWDNNGMNVMYKDRESLGFIQNRQGQTQEKIRDKNGKIIYQDPLKDKNYKTDKRTGEDYVMARVPGQKQLQKKTLRTNLALRDKYLQERSLATLNAQKELREQREREIDQDKKEVVQKLTRAQKLLQEEEKRLKDAPRGNKKGIDVEGKQQAVKELEDQLQSIEGVENKEAREFLELQRKITRMQTNLDLHEFGLQFTDQAADTDSTQPAKTATEDQKNKRGINGSWYDTDSYEGLYSSGDSVFPTQHPSVANEDGTFSNVKTITTEIDGKNYVIPSMVEGQQLSNEEAIQTAIDNGLEKYPSFDDPNEALDMSRFIHDKVDESGNYTGPDRIRTKTATLNATPKQDATDEENEIQAIGNAVENGTSALKSEQAIAEYNVSKNPTEENAQKVQKVKEKIEKRKPVATLDTISKLGPKGQPAGASLAQMLANNADIMDASKGPAKIGAEAFNGVDPGWLLNKYNQEALQLKTEEVYKELQAELGYKYYGFSQEKIEPILALLSPKTAPIVFGYEEGQIKPTDDPVLMDKKIEQNAFKALNDYAAYHGMEDLVGKKAVQKKSLNNREKAALAQYLSRTLKIDIAKPEGVEGPIRPTAIAAKWFDDNVDLDAYANARTKINDLNETWSEIVGIGTQFTHIPIDHKTKLGFQVRKKPGTTNTYEYKLDPGLSKTPEKVYEQETDTFLTDDGRIDERHFNFVIDKVDAYSDVGPLKDSWRRFSKSFTKGISASVFFPFQTAATVWGSENAEEWVREKRDAWFELLDNAAPGSVATDLKSQYDTWLRRGIGAVDAAGQLLTFHVGALAAGRYITGGTLVPTGIAAKIPGTKAISKIPMPKAAGTTVRKIPGVKWLNSKPILRTEIGARTGYAIGGYYSNYAMQMDAMLSEAIENGMDPETAFKELWLPGMAIAGVDTASDLFLLRGGEVLKSIIPKAAYDKLLSTYAGRLTGALGNYVAKMQTEGLTEGGQTMLENLIAKGDIDDFFGAGYDPNRDLDAGVADAYWIGSLIGGGVGGKAFLGEAISARSQAREYLENKRGLEKVNKAANGGQAAKNNLNDETGQENTNSDLHDQAKTYNINTNSSLHGILKLDPNGIGSIIANTGTNSTTQDDIIYGIIQGGDPVYGSIGIGNALSELQILTNKEISEIRDLVNQDTEATPEQMDQAIAALEGAVFIAREVESILDTGQATQDIFVEPLIDLGIVIRDQDGKLKVNTVAGRLLPPALRSRLEQEASAEGDGNVETPTQGSTQSGQKVDDLINQGKETFDQTAEAVANQANLKFYEIALGGMVIPYRAETLAAAEEYASYLARIRGTDEVPVTTEILPSEELPELTPGKKVEPETTEQTQEALDVDLTEQPETPTTQENVQEDIDDTDSEAVEDQDLRKREEEKEEESVQEEDAPSEERVLTSPLKLPVKEQQQKVDSFNQDSGKANVKVADLNDPEVAEKVDSDFLVAFEEATGTEVIVVEYEDDIADIPSDQRFGGVVPGREKNTIIVNADASLDKIVYAGHELAHTIKNTDKKLYDKLKEVLKDNLKAYPLIMQSVYKRGYVDMAEAQGLSDVEIWENLEEEAVANIMGDLFQDKKFWDMVNGKDRSLGGKLIDAFFRFLDALGEKISGSTKRNFNTQSFLGNIDDIRKGFAEVIRESKNAKRFKKSQGYAEAFNEADTTTQAQPEPAPQQETATQMNLFAVDPRTEAEYLRLAKKPKKNEKALQKLVDKTAKKAGYNIGPVYHGGGINNPNTKSQNFETGRASLIYFSESKEYSKSYGPVKPFYLKAEKVFDFVNNSEHRKKAIDLFNSKGGFRESAKDMDKDEIREYLGVIEDESGNVIDGVFEFDPDLHEEWTIFDDPNTDILFDLTKEGFDLFVFREDNRTLVGDKVVGGSITNAVLDSSQIKRADPITRDDQGKVIPLSQRFGESSDIRFALDPDQEARDVADEEATQRQSAEEQRREVEAEAGIRRPTRLGEFGNVRQRIGEYGTQEPGPGSFALDPEDSEFYSPLYKAFQDKFPGKASEDQARAFFKPGKTPGVTKAEADYMGINDYLDDYFGNGNKTITKEELDEFIENRQFKIEVKEHLNQFSDWTQKGGTNYRVLLFKRKKKKGEEAIFTGSHFEDDTLFHVRLKDREGPNGEKILFIEEVQSDWAAKYNSDDNYRPDGNGLEEAQQRVANFFNEIVDYFNSDNKKNTKKHIGEIKKYINTLNSFRDKIITLRQETSQKIRDNKDKIIGEYAKKYNEFPAAYQFEVTPDAFPDKVISKLDEYFDEVNELYNNATAFVDLTRIYLQENIDTKDDSTDSVSALAYQITGANYLPKFDQQLASAEISFTNRFNLLGDANSLEDVKLVKDLTEKLFAEFTVPDLPQFMDVEAAVNWRTGLPNLGIANDFLGYQNAVNNLELLEAEARANTKDIVPYMPWVKTYIEPALKHVIRLGIKNNYDQIAWAQGFQQIQLYEDTFRQNVKSIEWELDRDEWETFTENSDYPSANDIRNTKVLIQFEPKKDPGNLEEYGLVPLRGKGGDRNTTLDEVIGKKMANQIRSQVDQGIEDNLDLEEFTGTLQEEDMSIGGHFHKMVYDSMIPTFLKKYLKRFGATVERKPTIMGSLGVMEQDMASKTQADLNKYLKNKNKINDKFNAGLEEVHKKANILKNKIEKGTQYPVQEFFNIGNLMADIKDMYRKNIPSYVKNYLDADRGESAKLRDIYRNVDDGFTSAVADRVPNSIQNSIVENNNAAREFFQLSPTRKTDHINELLEFKKPGDQVAGESQETFFGNFDRIYTKAEEVLDFRHFTLSDDLQKQSLDRLYENKYGGADGRKKVKEAIAEHGVEILSDIIDSVQQIDSILPIHSLTDAISQVSQVVTELLEEQKDGPVYPEAPTITLSPQLREDAALQGPAPMFALDPAEQRQQLQSLAGQLNRGEITASQFRKKRDNIMPIVAVGAPDKLPKAEELEDALLNTETPAGKTLWETAGKPERLQDLINSEENLSEGDLVQGRLDISLAKAARANNIPLTIATIHKGTRNTINPKVTSYQPYLYVTDPTFITQSSKVSSIDIAKGAKKDVAFGMVGKYAKLDRLPSNLNTWTEVAFNPMQSSEFLDVTTKRPVVGGKSGLQVGNRIYVEDAQIMSEKDFMAMSYDDNNQFTGKFALDPEQDEATPFYSNVIKAIVDKFPKKASLDQALAFFKPGKTPGVKRAEVEYMDLPAQIQKLADEGKPITKEALLDIAEKNQFKIELVEKKEGYERWTQKGGDNFKLLLFKRVPNSKGDNNHYKYDYVGGHFDPDTAFHVRIKDRKGPNGEKILFIEEIQSDWSGAYKKEENIDNSYEIANLKEANEVIVRWFQKFFLENKDVIIEQFTAFKKFLPKLKQQFKRERNNLMSQLKKAAPQIEADYEAYIKNYRDLGMPEGFLRDTGAYSEPVPYRAAVEADVRSLFNESLNVLETFNETVEGVLDSLDSVKPGEITKRMKSNILILMKLVDHHRRRGTLRYRFLKMANDFTFGNPDYGIKDAQQPPSGKTGTKAWRSNKTTEEIFNYLATNAWIEKIYDKAGASELNKPSRVTEFDFDYRKNEYQPAFLVMGGSTAHGALDDYQHERIYRFYQNEDRIDLLQAEQRGNRDKQVGHMPYVDAYHQPALRHIVRYAVLNNYDQIAWTTGNQQIELYEEQFRQQVKSFSWEKVISTKYGEKTPVVDLTATNHENKDVPIGEVPLEGRTIYHSRPDFRGAKLEKFVGKKIANQIREEYKQQEQQKKLDVKGTIQDDDLSIGGHFHKLLYDTMIPSYLKKYLKKFGAKLEQKETLFEPVGSAPPPGIIEEITNQLDEYNHIRFEEDLDRNVDNVISVITDFQDRALLHSLGEKLMSDDEFNTNMDNMIAAFSNLFTNMRYNTPEFVQYLHEFGNSRMMVNTADGLKSLRAIFNRKYKGYVAGQVRPQEGWTVYLYNDHVAGTSIAENLSNRNNLSKLQEATLGDFLYYARGWFSPTIKKGNFAEVSEQLDAASDAMQMMYTREAGYKPWPNYKFGKEFFRDVDENPQRKEQYEAIKKAILDPNFAFFDQALRQIDYFEFTEFKVDQSRLIQGIKDKLPTFTDTPRLPYAPTVVITPEMRQSLKNKPPAYALDPIEGKKLAAVKGLDNFTQAMDRAPEDAILGAYQHIPATEENEPILDTLGDRVEQILQPTTEENPYARQAQSNAATFIGGMIKEGQPKELVNDLIDERRRLENYQGHEDLRSVIEDISYEDAVLNKPTGSDRTNRQNNFIKLYNKYKSKPQSSYYKAAAKALEKDFGSDWKDIAEGNDIRVIPSSFALDPDQELIGPDKLRKVSNRYKVKKGKTLPTAIVVSDTLTPQEAIDLSEDIDFNGRYREQAAYEINAQQVATFPILGRKGRKLAGQLKRTKDPDKRVFIADEIYETLIEKMQNNLRYLYNKMDKTLRKRAKLWYEGANRIAREFSNTYGLTLEKAAAIIATLSPQKDWFQNVSLAGRVIDIMTNQQDTKVTQEMVDMLVDIAGRKSKRDGESKAAHAARMVVEKREMRKELKDLNYLGKKLKDLNNEHAAWFVRAYDEVNNSRAFPIISPEGDRVGIKTKADGTPSKVGWGSYGEIGSAVGAFRSTTQAEFSSMLGDKHKVRNFYVNIVDPSNPKAITIDTHAVAAALFLPLAGASEEVSQNFGTRKGISSSGKVVGGHKGTYAVFHEAYLRTANELGILPRELQSITWEQVRTFFTDTRKGVKGFLDKVREIWQNNDGNVRSRQEVEKATRELDVAGTGQTYGLPDWAISERSEDGVEQSNISGLQKDQSRKMDRRSVAGRTGTGRRKRGQSTARGTQVNKFALDEEFQAKDKQREEAAQKILDAPKREKELEKEQKRIDRQDRRASRGYFVQGKFDYMDTRSATYGGSGRAGEEAREAGYRLDRRRTAVEEYSKELTKEIKGAMGSSIFGFLTKGIKMRKFAADLHTYAARINAVGVDQNGEYVFQGFDARMGYIDQEKAEKMGLTEGSYIVRDGATLRVGPLNEEINGHILLQRITPSEQKRFFNEFFDKYPGLAIFLERWINPDLKNDRYISSTGDPTPIFNRHALREVFAENEFGDPGFVEGYTPDIAKLTMIGGMYYKMKSLALRQGKKFGSIGPFKSGARKVKTGAAREQGAVMNIFQGFNQRAYEAHQEKITREHAFKILSAASKPVPANGQKPSDHVYIGKKEINDLIRGVVANLAQDSKGGKEFNELFREVLKDPENEKNLKTVLLNQDSDDFSPQEKKIINFLFGEENAIQFIGQDRMMDNFNYKMLTQGMASGYQPGPVMDGFLKAVDAVMGELVTGLLSGLGTIWFNWLAPQVQQVHLAMQHTARGLANGASTDQKNQEAANEHFRTAYHITKGLVLRRFTNWSGIDWFIKADEKTGLKNVTQEDYDKGFRQLWSEGQKGKAIKVLSDRKRYYNQFFDRDRFNNNTLASAFIDTSVNDSFMRDLLNLRIGSAILKAVRFQEIDVTAKQNMAYAAYRAAAQRRSKIEAKKARERGETFDRRKWENEWIKTADKTDPDIHKEAMGAALLFGFDYSNVPTWLASQDRRAKTFQRSFLTFGNFMYNYAKLLVKKSGPVTAFKAAKNYAKYLKTGKVPRDGIGGSEVRNSVADTALWAMAAIIWRELSGGDEEESEISPGTVGTNLTIEGEMQPNWWTQTGGKFNLDALPDWIGNSIRSYLHAYGADEAEGMELWMRGRSIPYVNALAAQGLFMNQLFGDKKASTMAALQESWELANEFIPFSPVTQVIIPTQYNKSQNIAQRATNLVYDSVSARVVPSPWRKLWTRMADPIYRRRYESKSLQYSPEDPTKKGYNVGTLEQIYNEILRTTPYLSRGLPANGKVKQYKVSATNANGDPTTLEDVLMDPAEADIQVDLANLKSMGLDLYKNTGFTVRDDGSRYINYVDPDKVRVVPPAVTMLGNLARIDPRKPFERMLGELGYDEKEMTNIYNTSYDRFIGADISEDIQEQPKKDRALQVWQDHKKTIDYATKADMVNLSDQRMAKRVQENEQITGIPKNAPANFLAKVVRNQPRDQFARMVDDETFEVINLKLPKSLKLIKINDGPDNDPDNYTIINIRDSKVSKKAKERIFESAADDAETIERKQRFRLPEKIQRGLKLAPSDSR